LGGVTREETSGGWKYQPLRGDGKDHCILGEGSRLELTKLGGEPPEKSGSEKGALLCWGDLHAALGCFMDAGRPKLSSGAELYSL